MPSTFWTAIVCAFGDCRTRSTDSSSNTRMPTTRVDIFRKRFIGTYKIKNKLRFRVR